MSIADDQWIETALVTHHYRCPIDIPFEIMTKAFMRAAWLANCSPTGLILQWIREWSNWCCWCWQIKTKRSRYKTKSCMWFRVDGSCLGIPHLRLICIYCISCWFQNKLQQKRNHNNMIGSVVGFIWNQFKPHHIQQKNYWFDTALQVELARCGSQCRLGRSQYLKKAFKKWLACG